MRRLPVGLVFSLAFWFVFSSCFSLSSFAKQATAVHFSDLPEVLQSGISAAIGRDDAAYAARVIENGFRVQNLRHRLEVDFTPAGVKLQTGGTHWGVALVGYGYGDAVRPTNRAAPQAVQNCVAYRRGAMTEWYVNGPAGLEQGFTLDEAPGKPNGEPLTVEMTLSGIRRGAVEKDGRGWGVVGSDGRVQLRYSGLTAHDATGKELRAWLEPSDDRLRLKVEDGQARYPIVIDPWVQLAELLASDGLPGDAFGEAVAMSGNTIVVGAPLVTVGGNQQQGAAYVFIKPPSGWTNMTETARLTASDGRAFDAFGLGVATNGSTVAVGAWRAMIGSHFEQGAVYVFARPKSGWKTTARFQAKLTASDGKANDLLGGGVAMEHDTIGTAVARLGGSAYIFVKPASGWKSGTQTAKLTASDGDRMDAVAISGNTVAASGDINTTHNAVYVYVQPANGWRDMFDTAKLTASDQTDRDDFGASTRISGNTIVAGSPYATVGGNTAQGAAYVFVKPATGWKNGTETAKLTASDGAAYNIFGTSLAIRGNTVAVGAPNAKIGHLNKGAAYIFLRPGGGWKTSSKFHAKMSANDVNSSSGFADHMCFGDNVLVVGALFGHPGHHEYGPGAVFLFIGGQTVR